MTRLDPPAAPQPGERAAVEARARRVRVVALLLVMPVLLASDLLAPDQPLPVLAVHVVLVVALAGVALALATRRIEVELAGHAALAGVAVAVMVSIGAQMVVGGEPDDLVGRLLGFHLWQLALVIPLSYLALEPRHARLLSLVLLGAAGVIVVGPLAPDLLAGEHPVATQMLLRIGLLLFVTVVLVHALAQTRVQLAVARALTTVYAEQARTDVLTGLGNRRRLEEVLADNIAEAGRYGTPLSVVLGDLDNFKALNDRFGHAVGDEVLTRIAERLSANVRSADLVGRWGGEEFLIVAPQTAGPEAATLAERCRAAVAGTPIARVGTTTISFGVAEWRRGESVHSLLTRADRALYEAKRRGRDLVVIDDDDRLIDLTAVESGDDERDGASSTRAGN